MQAGFHLVASHVKQCLVSQTIKSCFNINLQYPYISPYQHLFLFFFFFFLFFLNFAIFIFFSFFFFFNTPPNTSLFLLLIPHDEYLLLLVHALSVLLEDECWGQGSWIEKNLSPLSFLMQYDSDHIVVMGPLQGKITQHNSN